MFSVIICFLTLVAAPPAIEGDVDAIIGEIIPPNIVDAAQAKGGMAIAPLGKGIIQGAPAAKCTADGLNRLDCGFPGITADQCAIKGCCFSLTQNEGPYCFYPDGEAEVGINAINPIKDAVCSFSDLFRVSCGDAFTELECRNKGCCYEEASAVKCSYGFIPAANSAIGAPLAVNNQIQQGIVIGGGEVQIQGVQGACALVAAGARVDCGFDGITEDECTQKECCFGLLPKGQEGPVCFQKQGAPKAGVAKAGAAKGFGYKNAV